MPIKETARYRVLASILQTSFGKSSQTKRSTHFVSMSMPDEARILVKYQSIVNFGHQNVQAELRHKYEAEAIDAIKEAIERVAVEYKQAVESRDDLLEPRAEPYESAPQKTIKIKVNSATIHDSFEGLTKSIYNPVGTSYYRLSCIAEIT